jgi:hypothetical protein
VKIVRLSDRCRSELYRLRIDAPGAHYVFLMAHDAEHASRRARAALSILHDIPLHEARVQSLDSFGDMMCFGVSEDHDLRVFEAVSKAGRVTTWIYAPLFLTADTSLLGKWAELQDSNASSDTSQPRSWRATASWPSR